MSCEPQTIVPVHLTAQDISDLGAITNCLQSVLQEAFGGDIKAEVFEVDARIIQTGVRLNLHLRASKKKLSNATSYLTKVLQEVAILKLQAVADGSKWP